MKFGGFVVCSGMGLMGRETWNIEQYPKRKKKLAGTVRNADDGESGRRRSMEGLPLN